MEDMLAEQALQKELIYDGRVVHLEKWQVRLPNGKTAQREIVKHVGAVAVVAVDDMGRAAMVRQFRTPLGETLTEIPAGKLDSKAEDHLEAAKRELREETGLTARKWRRLTDVVTSPGFCDETIALYLATDLQKGESQPDEDEFLTAEMIPYDELIEKIYAGEIRDQKTALALLMAGRYIK